MNRLQFILFFLCIFILFIVIIIVRTLMNDYGITNLFFIIVNQKTYICLTEDLINHVDG